MIMPRSPSSSRTLIRAAASRQLLLEHLAQAARERGITRFVAEVLPANRRMAKVFADAGYRVSKGIEDGVLAVEFPILPTDTLGRRDGASRASCGECLCAAAADAGTDRGVRQR